MTQLQPHYFPLNFDELISNEWEEIKPVFLEANYDYLRNNKTVDGVMKTWVAVTNCELSKIKNKKTSISMRSMYQCTCNSSLGKSVSFVMLFFSGFKFSTGNCQLSDLRNCINLTKWSTLCLLWLIRSSSLFTVCSGPKVLKDTETTDVTESLVSGVAKCRWQCRHYVSDVRRLADDRS